jgi:polyhydroxybutyrate depolymerase
MNALDASTWATRCAMSTMLVAAACASEYTKSVNGGWSAGTAEHSIAVASDDRTFLLHVPTLRPRNRLGATVAFPLVILLHGSGADGETIRRQSRIEALADSLRFVVAYPNGKNGLLGFGSDWNAGTCCGNAARSHVDDVAFVRAVMGEVSRHIPIDRRRIYVAGFSDGGRMAYRVACDAASLVAAIGVVSGSLRDEQCAPLKPVPVIAFHGTADPEVPYTDSALTQPKTPAPAAAGMLPPSIRFWSAVDGCRGVALRRETVHVTRASFAPCAGADVVLYTIEDGLHAWPGGAKDGASGAEPTTEVHATETMVQFFFRHPLR